MVFAIFYFIVIVPSKRQQKKVQEFLDNLKVNDKVITTSGIFGQMMKLDEQSRAAADRRQGQYQGVESGHRRLSGPAAGRRDHHSNP